MPGSVSTPRIKAVFTLLSSGATTQAMQLLLYPVVTRLYAPADFGHYLLYSTTVLLLSNFATLKLDAAILAGRTRDIPALQRLVVVSVTATSAVAGIAIFAIQAAQPATAPAGEWGRYWAFLPLSLFMQSIYMAALSSGIREKRYRHLAHSQIAVSGTLVGLQMLLGLTSPGVVGLLVADIAARVAGLAALGLRIPSRGLTCQREGLRYLALWRRYRSYPFVLAPATLLNSGSQQLQNILFPLVFTPASAGQFALASKVLGAPVGLMTQAVNNVYAGDAVACREHPARLREATLAMLHLTTACALPLLACSALVAPPLFKWCFGADWQVAGDYAAIFAVGLSAALIVSPLSSLITIQNSLRTALYFAVVEIVVRASAFLAGAALGTEHATLWMLSAGNVLLYAIGLLRFLNLAHLSFTDYFRRVRGLLGIASAAFLPAVLVVSAGGPAALSVAVAAAGLAAYTLVALRQHRREYAS